MAEKYQHTNLGDIADHVYIKATITAVESSDDTATIEGDGISGSGVPIFYHCEPDSEHRSNGAIYAAAAAFSIDDEVYVMCEGSAGSYTPVRIVGFVDGIKTCCLYKYLFTNSEDTWTDEGIVAEAINEGYPYSLPGNYTSLSMVADTGVLESTIPGQSYYTGGPDEDPPEPLQLYTSFCTTILRYDNLTEDNPIPLNISGSGLYLIEKISTLYSLASIAKPVWTGTVPYWTNITPRFFIEILNNRGHYYRATLNYRYDLLLSDDALPTPNDHTIYHSNIIAGCYCTTGRPSYQEREMLDPVVGYVNLYSNIWSKFLDIERTEREEEPGVYDYFVINDAEFWIIGAGFFLDNQVHTFATGANITIDFDEIALCPNIPSAPEEFPDRLWEGYLSQSVFYNVEDLGTDIKYPYYAGAYSSEDQYPE